MKDIQEIMLEMDNLGEQIATTLNEEDDTKDICEPQETPACPIGSRCVPFCCLTNCPDNFVPNTSNVRITYDLSCLKAKVEPVCTLGIVVYKVKVVGCIPFVANVQIDTTPTPPICTRTIGTNPPSASLCCGCCVCVDEDICTTNSEWVAFTKAASINFNCTNVDVIGLAAERITEGGVNCGVKVSGSFKLTFDRNCCPF